MYLLFNGNKHVSLQPLFVKKFSLSAHFYSLLAQENQNVPCFMLNAGYVFK